MQMYTEHMAHYHVPTTADTVAAVMHSLNQAGQHQMSLGVKARWVQHAIASKLPGRGLSCDVCCEWLEARRLQSQQPNHAPLRARDILPEVADVLTAAGVEGVETLTEDVTLASEDVALSALEAILGGLTRRSAVTPVSLVCAAIHVLKSQAQARPTVRHGVGAAVMMDWVGEWGDDSTPTGAVTPASPTSGLAGDAKTVQKVEEAAMAMAVVSDPDAMSDLLFH
jgi:hypothetical protein